jgi:predicted dehydrogenase
MVSEVYLEQAALFDAYHITAVSDRDMDRAVSIAERHAGVRACAVDELMADDTIDVVLNLTTPRSHAPVSLQAIGEGKHVYSEKPLAATVAEAAELIDSASRAGVRIGCAHDAFLGGGTQSVRKLIDDGAVGSPVSASGSVLLFGPETWHEEPHSFYDLGGGPLFDVGVYYVTALVSLLGPVARVSGAARVVKRSRVIRRGPHAGTECPALTPTYVSGTLMFQSGSIATVNASFDAVGGRDFALYIQGTGGTIRAPNPCMFGESWRGVEPIELWRQGERGWTEVPYTHPYSRECHGLGLQDMVLGIRGERPHRASHELALHVLEIMESILSSAERGEHIDIQSTCSRPEPMPEEQGAGVGE